MSVSTAGMPVVERHVRASIIAKNNGETLLALQDRLRRDRLERWKLWQRTEERSPTQIGSRETRRGDISLDVGRREAASRLAARNVVAIDALERADQRRIFLPSESNLRVLG